MCSEKARRGAALALVLWLGAGGAPARAQAGKRGGAHTPGAGAVVVRDWLVLDPVDRRGRRPFLPDTVFARYLAEPGAAAPKPGEEVAGTRTTARWRALGAKPDGGLAAPRGGVAFARWPGPDGVFLAELRGASRLFAGGAPLPGDVYGWGFPGPPVRLAQGEPIFVAGIRGGFRLRFVRPEQDGPYIAAFDPTLPDLAEGEGLTGPAAFVLVNPTGLWTGPLALSVRGPALAAPARVEIPEGLAPFSLRKEGVPLAPRPAPKAGPLTVELSAAGRVLHRRAFTPAVRPAAGPHRHTFFSGIDGSVQEYAVLPPEDRDAKEAGLVLTLHGAGVPCLNQVRAYSPKRDLWIVAPTNRRPFGFDWQDWGRIDAYEVLARARALTGAARARTYLTGHSMGGHGVWHLAANDADGFAAAAPSAGWRSFATYAGGLPETPLARLWDAADRSSDLRALAANLVALPLFVLHGAADPVVPLSEAEGALALLRAAGRRDVPHHFEPGAKHWWNGKAARGTDCVDWPAIFALFERSRIAQDPGELNFVTAAPDVDAAHHWIRVEQALDYGAPISVRARRDRKARRIQILTHNLRAFSLALPRPLADPRAPFDPAKAWRLLIDGFEIALAPSTLRRGRIHLVRRSGSGPFEIAAAPPPATEKGPGHEGPIKRAFDHGFVLVTGTAGDDAEDRALLARARYDAALWWYRANGRTRLVTDRFLLAHLRDPALADANLILYGNADTNAAWGRFAPPGGPLAARRGRLVWRGPGGALDLRGPDTAALVVRPRPDRADRLVLLCADTGPGGRRAALHHLLFVSGVGYPDFVLFTQDVLRSGDRAVLRAGFFDATWR